MLTVQAAAALMRVGREPAYSLVAERRIPSVCVHLVRWPLPLRGSGIPA